MKDLCKRRRRARLQRSNPRLCSPTTPHHPRVRPLRIAFAEMARSVDNQIYYMHRVLIVYLQLRFGTQSLIQALQVMGPWVEEHGDSKSDSESEDSEHPCMYHTCLVYIEAYISYLQPSLSPHRSTPSTALWPVFGSANRL